MPDIPTQSRATEDGSPPRRLSVRCRVCGDLDEHRAYSAREMMFGMRESFDYFECRRCGCLQIREIPAEMGRYYPADYYSYQTVGAAKGRLRRALARRRNAYAVFDRGLLGRGLYALMPNPGMRHLARVRPDRRTRFLDVGCGSGDLVLALHDVGLTHVLGIDPFNPEDIVYDNGVRVERKTVDDVDGTWDVVLFNHAFEHVPDPAGTIGRVAQILAPGGWAVLRMPTVSSWAWRHYRVDWVQLDAPRHTAIHSIESVRVLARTAGLTLEDVVYVSGPFQFWGSEQYRRDIPLRDPRSYAGGDAGASIFSAGDIRTFARRARELNAANDGDEAVFYLRAPSATTTGPAT